MATLAALLPIQTGALYGSTFTRYFLGASPIGSYTVRTINYINTYIVPAINDLLAGSITVTNVSATTIAATGTTQSTSSTTGSLQTTGGLGVTKNANIGGLLVTAQAVVTNTTPVVVVDTAGATLAVVTSGIIAGAISSISAAGVTLTLDSVANIITAFGVAGVTIGKGSTVEFTVDNSSSVGVVGSNAITVAADSGATITAAKQISNGDTAVACSLVVAATNITTAVGRFALYFTSGTTANLFRVG
jgi:hypothetical protein